MKPLNKYLTLTLSLLLSAALILPAQDKQQWSKAPEWNIDQAHSSVNFDIKHFFNTIRGQFHDIEGDIHFDPNDLNNSKVVFSMEVASIDTDHEKRDGHLRSEDFFDAEKYPLIKFTSDLFELTGPDTYLMHGDLTIKGHTKHVAIPFEVTGVMAHPMMENTSLMGIELHKTIQRSNFDVGTGKWASTTVIGDDVDISIFMELVRELDTTMKETGSK